MLRMLLSTLILSLLITSCSNNSKKADDPCGNCCFVSESLRFRLIDAKTGEDLVSGSQSIIPVDSIHFLLSDNKSGYYRRATGLSTQGKFLYGPGPWPGILLEIGLPGGAKKEKITINGKSVNCCTTGIASVTVGENPVPVQKDSSGVYLIPYSR
ncbi:hypothetical protein [Chitinophaga qingshengii]|uniref:Uncharacterized protein n=1 Tax=Chitinophaga qingshengii TaxID=1569794 RepID=A0ABR7TQN2_9BACT|nr:hypothetical protein [Chitinophaga qingshengii]MBC9931314.1 hypothetical protein [Chitinophaga qingshengii]